MHVSTVFLITMQPSNKLAAKLMATIRAKSLTVYPTISTQRAQGILTCKGIFTRNTLRSMTRWLRTTNGITSLWPWPTMPLPMVPMPLPDQCRCFQKTHSWSTLCASSSLIIRYSSPISSSFMPSHTFQVDSHCWMLRIPGPIYGAPGSPHRQQYPLSW